MALIYTYHTVSQADCQLDGSYETFNHPTEMVNTPTPRTDYAFEGDLSVGTPPQVKTCQEAKDFARQLEREVSELKRGEFICRKCGLRKNNEHERGDF